MQPVGALTDICTPLFSLTFFPISKRWEKPKCPSTKEWINKMWYFYTMEYYSALKRKDLHEVPRIIKFIE